ncbi:tetratricopeptide repeat protein [Frankia gtarii]|nr:tetratricopeptide repeat protein [Frankia gtarii]
MDAMGPEWQKIEKVLDRRVSPRVRARLALVAGQYAFYLGILAFDLGDDDTARGLLTVASQHAAQAKDLLPASSPRRSDVSLLDGSVAAIRSSVAYFSGSYGEAADIAAQAREGAHPFARPILAGCEARAAVLAHRPDDAYATLADMQEHVWDGAIMPGPNPGDAAFVHSFLAIALAHLGNGVEAEPHARISLELEIAAGPDHYVQIGGNYTALARTYLRRPEPDPERAADATRQALLAVEGRPTRGVVQRAAEMWRQLDARWPELPAVRDLGEIVKTSGRALQAASGDATAV